MRIYLGSQSGAIIHYWAGKYPDLVGQCFSPPQFAPKDWLPYFLDNGAYKYYANQQPFDKQAFFKHLSCVKLGIKKPIFVVVPDAIGSHAKTLEMWNHFYPLAKLQNPNLNYAFVAQDGCNPEDVPIEADFVFIGGTDSFKKPVLKDFAEVYPNKVHVGRVNNLDFVFRCHELGIASVDGTGWFRSNHGKPIYKQLEIYFDYVSKPHDFNTQLKLFL